MDLQTVMRASLFGLVVIAMTLGVGGCGGGPVPASNSTAEPPPAADPPATEASPDSVGDVVADGLPPELTGGSTSDTTVTVSLSVRNDSNENASVTVAFFVSGLQVDVALAQVRPGTITRVSSAALADRIEVTGVTDSGSVISRQTFLRGGAEPEAWSPEYVIVAPAPAPPPPSPSPPPTITVLEPSASEDLAIGSTITVRWNDENTTPQSTVVLWLRPLGDSDRSTWRRLGPPLAGDLDGINDQVDVVIEADKPGAYEIVAEMTTGGLTDAATSPSIIRLHEHSTNTAPRIQLLTPLSPVQVNPTDTLRISWADEDPDSSAVVSVYLTGLLPSGELVSFLLGASCAEDPDGPEADAVIAVLGGILPGTYDIVAVITDGLLSGTSRLSQVVTVRDTGTGIQPEIDLYEPSHSVRVSRDGSLFVAWQDSDPDSNALISLMLDPDVEGDLDGNEVLLVTSISEDPDGDGADNFRIGFPPTTPIGTYRVAATISDGTTQRVSFAPGYVTLIEGGGDHPRLDAVWPLMDEKQLDTGAISFGALFHDVDLDLLGSTYSLTARLTNGLVDLDLIEAAIAQRNGNAIVWTVNLSRVHVPEDTPQRRFDIVIELWEEGRLVSQSTAPGGVFVFQTPMLSDIQLLGVTCMGGHRTLEGELQWTWSGGGFDAESENQVEFWLVHNGTWPVPFPDDRHYRRILTADASPGTWVTEHVLYSDFADMDEGDYALVAVVYDPLVGEQFTVRPDLPVTICLSTTEDDGSPPGP